MTALSEHKVVGYLVSLHVAGEITVMDIVVSQEYRRKGIAKRLLAQLLSEAQIRQDEHIFLEVRASNTDAQALYTTLGFKVIDERKHYYPGVSNPDRKENALIMQRSVT